MSVLEIQVESADDFWSSMQMSVCVSETIFTFTFIIGQAVIIEYS